MRLLLIPTSPPVAKEEVFGLENERVKKKRSFVSIRALDFILYELKLK